MYIYICKQRQTVRRSAAILSYGREREKKKSLRLLNATNWYRATECHKIYRKFVLHLIKYVTNLYLSRCSTDLRINLGTLNIIKTLREDVITP